jgi:Zn finger protein HypA/HybF involved in hydrogenase expression
MFITTETETVVHTRISKLGKEHEYNRTRIVAVFRCDNCGEGFRRLKEKISPKRLNNNYFHCCPNCDAKRFAQKKGAERRTIWDMPVNSDLDISRL